MPAMVHAVAAAMLLHGNSSSAGCPKCVVGAFALERHQCLEHGFRNHARHLPECCGRCKDVFAIRSLETDIEEGFCVGRRGHFRSSEFQWKHK